MAGLKIYAFLIHPGKNEEAPQTISGNRLGETGKLFDMLASIFHSNPDSRDFEITFRSDQIGKQNNECRNVLIKYYSQPNKKNGLPIAQRLQSVTDKRSGMGLLFLMAGQHGVKQRLVISRFPANEAILAEVAKNGLNVEYLERVFIKRMTAYKAIMLEHRNPPSGFWSGMATDRQAGASPENISDYWLNDFLDADFTETPQAGTRRLAEALRGAVKHTPLLNVKAEITAAISLAPSALAGQKISIDGFCQHFGLSNDAKLTITSRLEKASLANKVFLFDAAEFKTRVPYRSVEMDSGAILTAPTENFSEVFTVTAKASGKVEYSTVGRVRDERLSKK